jgi:IS4 transposase
LVAVRAPQEVVDQRRRQLRKLERAKGKTVGKHRFAACAWTVFITNVPADRLTVAEVLTLARARWQIELLFKRWKSHGTIDASRSQKPYRVLCDVYAKLLAMVVQHWLFLVNLWAYPDRSLVKAAKTVKRRALELARSFRKRTRLVETITSIGQCITGCRMNRRKQEPNTYQLLLDASLLGMGMPDEQA